MFGTIPGNPLAVNRPEKVAHTEKVQREDRRDKSNSQRGKFSKKRSQDDDPGSDKTDSKPDLVGKRIDLEA